MAEVALKGLTISFGGFKAVDNVTLTVPDGEFVVYLGPSGCGKTTTLRCIAGLADATSGEVLFDGRRVNELSSSERNVAMVFQFVSLYPHLKIRENIVFPLKARGVSRAEIKRKLDWVTGVFRLEGDLDHYPSALPPGARQKVALARAVIRDPAVLLLDEPLSAIDEQFREEMRWELGHLQRELGVTTIYVTHDQREAMSLADRIVLMSDGRIVQVGEPNQIYFDPVTLFAGEFIGSPSMNFIDLSPVSGGLQLGGSDITLTPDRNGVPDWAVASRRRLKLGIRPINVHLVESGADGAFPVQPDDIFSVGRERYFTFAIGGQLCQGVDLRSAAMGGSDWVRFAREGLMFFDADTGARVQRSANVTEPMLKLRGLRKSYGAKPALRGLDLDVPDNQIIALLGPTGAGKTSTLLASAGLVPLDAGRVSLAGVDVSEADPSARDVSIVFEGYNLLPVLDVKDNIAFALRSPTYREPEAEIRERVGRTAELLRIAHLLDRSVETLSGGERQRVAIARALVRRPKLFLLDEPLSALDLKLREGLRAELKAIHRKYSSTMLYATHDYHGAIAIADQIAVIEGGRIQQFGPIETIFARPANMRVGQLIGSPSMAFFDAVVAEGAIAVVGGEQRMALADFGALRMPGDVRIKLGAWPEDIEIREPGASGGNSGSVYAVDNRGYEQAVQVNAEAGRFRKVLPSGVDLRQGDACSFHVRSGFLFNAQSGEQLAQMEKA